MSSLAASCQVRKVEVRRGERSCGGKGQGKGAGGTNSNDSFLCQLMSPKAWEVEHPVRLRGAPTRGCVCPARRTSMFIRRIENAPCAMRMLCTRHYQGTPRRTRHGARPWHLVCRSLDKAHAHDRDTARVLPERKILHGPRNAVYDRATMKTLFVVHELTCSLS